MEGDEVVMKGENYYNILGVNKSASGADIKKSYRKLAMKYHPDKTKGDTVSENKFKKISEAYAVLSDEHKRKQYDNFGSEGFRRRYSQEDIFKNFDLRSVFGDFGQQNSRFSFGGFNFDGNQRSLRGSDLVYELPLVLREVAFGATKIVHFSHDNITENISVKIPPGMISGKKLRLVGKGERSRSGGDSGDLFVKSVVLPNKKFDVQDYDLKVKETIRFTEAILGTVVLLSTLDNGQLSLKIPPGTKHKTKMRVSGRGLPHMSGSSRGDLYVTIDVDMPDNLSERQRELIQELSNTGL